MSSNLLSTFFFPLRTNVEYFATPEGVLSFEERVKQALILYERVVFEAGLYEATLGPDGTWDTLMLPSQASRPEKREPLSDAGSDCFSVWVQPGGPGTAPQFLFSSSIERSFQSEFHSLFDKLSSQFNADGLEIRDWHLPEAGKQYAATLAEEYLKMENAVLPAGSARPQRRIVRNLFQDLLLAAALGYASGVDPLHAPMLSQIVHQSAELGVASGFSALEFQVPHVAALPWEKVFQVRKDPAIVEFRQKLFQVESTVRYMLPEASESEIKWEVGKILHKELVHEVGARMSPSGAKLAGSVVAQIAGGIFPPLGTIQTACSIGEQVANSVQEKRSWLAVLMKLSRVSWD